MYIPESLRSRTLQTALWARRRHAVRASVALVLSAALSATFVPAAHAQVAVSSSYPTPDGIQQSDGCYYALKRTDVVSPTPRYEFSRWRTSCDFTASDGNKYLVNDKTQVWHSYSTGYQYALKQRGTWSILTNKGWMTLDAYNSVLPPAEPQPQPAGGNNPQPNLLQDANDHGKIQGPIDSGMRVWTRPKDCLMNHYGAECTAIRAQKDQAERERLERERLQRDLAQLDPAQRDQARRDQARRDAEMQRDN